MVWERLGGTRHQTARDDHDGSWRTCDGCRMAALYTMFALGGRARSNGWDRDEALAFLTTSFTRVKSLAKDGERMRAVDDGGAAKPDVAARSQAFGVALNEAWDHGDLSQAPEVAVEVLRWAITFAGDPGERVAAGRKLPFDRIARTVIGGPDTARITDEQVEQGWAAISPDGAPDLLAQDRVERLWNEIEVACAASPQAMSSLDQLVSSRSDRLSLHTTLWREGGEGGGPTFIDDVRPLRSLWSVQGTGEDSKQMPSDLVASAVHRLEVDPRPWQTSADEQRERIAAEALLAELSDRHGPLAPSISKRPEVTELALEVLAEATYLRSA